MPAPDPFLPASASDSTEKWEELVLAVSPFMLMEEAEGQATLVFQADEAAASGLDTETIEFGTASEALIMGLLAGEEPPKDYGQRHVFTNWYDWFAGMADPCNHNWTRYGPYRDRAATEQVLRNSGFYPTPRGYGSDQWDWTRPVNHNGVPMSTGHATYRAGAYRYHARVDSSNPRYLRIQGSPSWAPEPNPVLATYVWPAWWWPYYVYWFHEVYC